MSLARGLVLSAIALAPLALPACKATSAPDVATPHLTSESAKPVAKAEPLGPPIDFILDPVLRDAEFQPASEQLRGKRAIVVVVTTWDGSSLVLLRNLAPLLRTLPADTQCMLVAMQPLADRPLISTFFDAEETPCIRAIGDPARARLGDLAKIKVIPATLVLRADGVPVGVAAGVVTAASVKDELEKAK